MVSVKLIFPPHPAAGPKIYVPIQIHSISLFCLPYVKYTSASKSEMYELDIVNLTSMVFELEGMGFSSSMFPQRRASRFSFRWSCPSNTFKDGPRQLINIDEFNLCILQGKCYTAKQISS